MQGADVHKRMPWFDRSEIRLYAAGFVATLVLMPIILAALAAAAARVDIAEIWRCVLVRVTCVGFLPCLE